MAAVSPVDRTICARCAPRPHGIRSRVSWCCLALAATLLCATRSTADSPFSSRDDPSKATNSRAARDEAVRSIPYKHLEAGDRAKVNSVLANSGIYRRLPTRVVQCDPDFYLFLVEHPDVIVSIWQVLGITQLAVEQVTPDKYRVTDAEGTHGTVEFLYSSHDVHLIYAEGIGRGPLLDRPIQGHALILLKTGYVCEPDGRYYVTSRMDTFLEVDRSGIELVTKTLQPVLGKVADSNFLQTVGFLGSLSKTAEVNLSGMQRLADKLSAVQPDVRRQFAELARQVSEKAQASPTAADKTGLAEKLSKTSSR